VFFAYQAFLDLVSDISHSRSIFFIQVRYIWISYNWLKLTRSYWPLLEWVLKQFWLVPHSRVCLFVKELGYCYFDQIS